MRSSHMLGYAINGGSQKIQTFPEPAGYLDGAADRSRLIDQCCLDVGATDIPAYAAFAHSVDLAEAPVGQPTLK
jgi:hypothetical protein